MSKELIINNIKEVIIKLINKIPNKCKCKCCYSECANSD